MKKALETVYQSFEKQLEEHKAAIAKLESEVLQRRELALKLEGALEGFALVDQEAKKPENMPFVQLDDEDEDEDEDDLEKTVGKSEPEKETHSHGIEE
tara:strand:- start:375 stop:668 length:294 start_codon:yes stop_codon:yes gene_type:complete